MTVLACCLLPVCFLLLFPLAWLELGGRWKGVLPVTLCAFLLAYGWFAFFGQRGGLGFVGEAFEWPLVWTGGAVENARGERFVPVIAPGRIQVYGREGEFLRGWFIPASGGRFKLHVTEDDNLEVFTSRGNRRLVFAADGTLLGDGQYREDYDRLPTGPACRVDSMSPWYLWPLAFAFVPLAFVFSVVSLGWIYGMQVAAGEFHLARSVSGIPMILVCAVFWTIALMAVCGKVVVTVNLKATNP
jgi:hypothetical protein